MGDSSKADTHEEDEVLKRMLKTPPKPHKGEGALKRSADKASKDRGGKKP